MNVTITDRLILLNLCASLTMSDNMGDVAEDVWQTLKLMGIVLPDDVDDLEDLGGYLDEVHETVGLWKLV